MSQTTSCFLNMSQCSPQRSYTYKAEHKVQMAHTNGYIECKLCTNIVLQDYNISIFISMIGFVGLTILQRIFLNISHILIEHNVCNYIMNVVQYLACLAFFRDLHLRFGATQVLIENNTYFQGRVPQEGSMPSHLI